MSVVVKMEMPKRCDACGLRFVCQNFINFFTTKESGYHSLIVGMEGCLILCELPEKHGRLVDADACGGVLKKLENEAVRPTEKLCYGFSARMFEEANTIVPAERREE